MRVQRDGVGIQGSLPRKGVCKSGAETVKSGGKERRGGSLLFSEKWVKEGRGGRLLLSF